MSLEQSHQLKIIQGGMGAGVSTWCLAKCVSQLGQLGVVSGTALDEILARRLQDGDPGGHMQRALENFPKPEIAQAILDKYYIPGGKKPDTPYRRTPMFTIKPNPSLVDLVVAANFTEVFLAKEGHSGKVGINYLGKIPLPNLASLYGAMLAGVDYVLMGAGIPREIPGTLDRLALHEEVSLKLHVEGASPEDSFKIHFNPKQVIPSPENYLKRPKFLAIVAFVVLAKTLIKKSNGKVDGFIIEGPTAGGHNAPPRGQLQLNEKDEPVYGHKDVVDLKKIKELGLPFWLAGSYAEPHKIDEALAAGANGVQVGTLFAFCNQSGLSDKIKRAVLEKARNGSIEIFTDPRASPTGFPFKVIQLPGTMSQQKKYEDRQRVCDLGYLRHIYKAENGTLRFRCPSEPVSAYINKGGKVEETLNRKCLCNSLIANIGQPQIQKNGIVEEPLVTAGDDVVNISRILKANQLSYSAEDVIQYLLSSKSADIKD